MNYYEIGQRIRKYRKAQGLSQENLAEKAGISVTHMSHIETGNTKLSLPVFVRIAEVLGVQTDELLHAQGGKKTIAINGIIDILDQSTVQQIRILEEVLRATKAALDKHIND